MHATADIFANLKRNYDEPDPAAAAAVGQPMGADGRPGGPATAEAAVNQSAIELLRKLPGVTEANYRGIMAACGNLRELADTPLEKLEVIMGGAHHAKMLRDFLDAPCPRL